MIKKGPSLLPQPAKRERLSDIVYGQILEYISKEGMEVGNRLPPEQEFCSAFGVSRPVVREALMRLQADGLVYSRQGAGTFIDKVPPADMMQFTQSADVADYLRSYEIRMGLETEAARLAAINRNQNDLGRLNQAMIKLRHAHDHGAPEGAEDFEFHLAIADATGNVFFGEILHQIRKNVIGHMTLGSALTHLGPEARRRRVLEEHENIVSALEKADPDAAAKMMRTHLINARERLTDKTWKSET